MAKAPYVSQPMRIQARPHSPVEKLYANSGLPQPDAIAPGVGPQPSDDLIFHGGKLVPQMEFQNIFLGGQAAWKASDIDLINASITAAMQDANLNNMLRQYFKSNMTCDPRPAIVLEEARPAELDEPDVKAMVQRLVLDGKLSDSDLDTTIFNLLLPPGTILKLGDANSLDGLGGYHGSVHFTNKGQEAIAYYSANVFSQQLPGGQTNGIPAFDASWKDVVGTLYHELNEYRTDADVSDAIAKKDNQFLGWMSGKGQEIGDQPIAVAQSLALVFKEILSTSSGKRLPVQFLYSNAVHGAEGPIARPH
jgi:hypothetical protein